MAISLESIRKFVIEEMEGVCGAHDVFHIERVVVLAEKLHVFEGATTDLAVIQAGAWLHEALDDKFFDPCMHDQRVTILSDLLFTAGYVQKQVEDVIFIISNVGYGKSLERGASFEYTKELQIVEDADRLESLGAIAIARTFAYGGRKGLPIHDPSISIKKNLTREEYAKTQNTSITHFYEKLLKLKDLMHTTSANRIAQQRHEFLETFLTKFFEEWNCEIK